MSVKLTTMVQDDPNLNFSALRAKICVITGMDVDEYNLHYFSSYYNFIKKFLHNA